MEFAARLPDHFKLRRSTLKYLLKKVGGDLLPPEHLRRRKMGFGVPVGQWMRNEFRPMLEDVLLGPDARTRRFFQRDPLQRLTAAHLQGKHDYSYQLWALLWLELWCREFLV